MRKILMIFSFTIAVALGSNAQDINFLDQYADLKNEKDSIVKVLKSKETLISLLNDTIRQQTSQIENLNTSLAAVSAKDATLNDSIVSLNDSIKKLISEIAGFEAERNRFDDLRVKYANGRLQFPYDKKRADEALKLFSEIQNQDIRQDYVDLPTCFRDFPKAIEYVRATMVELEASREGFTKFSNSKWQDKAKEILNKDTYANTYAKNYRNGVSIYYLDDILAEASARISKTTDPRDISFQDLIIKLGNP